MSLTTVYISIGNSDDRLTQKEWAAFALRTHLAVDAYAREIHGSWYSGPATEYQNACWCAQIPERRIDGLKDRLRELARDFRQDSIAWAVAPDTEFLGAPS
ncbi:hypothetical protein [Micromonospora sp. WMMD998]|uniref:hypothetical protein n=1 Tax=Micromonospora sp. WMMD998 TaxID=3016092 RepID=UPI00249B4E92|nr:hypothetical protein [Micromonospora sp. WMMD998]WFE41928.1 hypothetical protein O7619_27170 [Micromonospora sp. WMMD998]